MTESSESWWATKGLKPWNPAGPNQAGPNGATSGGRLNGRSKAGMLARGRRLEGVNGVANSADLEKWEARYTVPDAEAGEPEPFVLEVLEALPRTGQAIDLAGGLGRHALVLAERGLDVLLTDISPSGLAVARRHAMDQKVALGYEARDLMQDGLPVGPFDVVLVSWFLLTDHLWAQLPSRLRPGAHFVHVQPTLRNLERHERPSSHFLVPPGSLDHRAEAVGLRVQRFEEGWDAKGHHTARLHARAPG